MRPVTSTRSARTFDVAVAVAVRRESVALSTGHVLELLQRVMDAVLGG